MTKKSLLLMLSLVLALTIGLGSTLAYLTDSDTKTNVFTMGNVDIELNEDYNQNSTLMPDVDINKDAWITNKGNNPAYVWMTVAVPAEADPAIDLNWAEGVTPEDAVDAKDADGNDYKVYLVKVDKDLFEGEYAPLQPGKETPVLLDSVTMKSNVDVQDGQYVLVENGAATPIDYDLSRVDIPVSAFAIQSEGFDSFEEAFEAYGTQWGDFIVKKAETVSVGSSEELKEALAADEEQIIVELTDDVVYDVAAWNQNGLGGASTNEVVILGNGNTIDFNQTNSDWNNIVTNNGATLVLSNVNITNSGHNDGPWNRHDLNFGCDVKMNNVTSDKAFAFKAGATLNNVTISDANNSDTYAIWIQPNGQTVTLDNVTIDMMDCTDGRGIKIDELYVSAPAKVTLNVSNTTFKTEEKAAIIVKSAAGADITLDKVDISGVAADSTNPVWVDEASAAYADLVTVTGGSKIVEP